MHVRQSIILLSTKFLLWEAKVPADITAESLSIIPLLSPPVEVHMLMLIILSYSSLRSYSVTLYIQYILTYVHTYIPIYIRTYIYFCCIFISPSMRAFHRCNMVARNSDIAARVRGAAAVAIPERTHFSFSIPRNLRGSHEFRFCTLLCNTYIYTYIEIIQFHTYVLV